MKKDKKLVITPLDESKEVSQVLANDTCRKILDILSDEPMSTSLVAERLNLPLTTVDYNIKKLKKVNLIDVHHKRWSPKGKKVPYYAPQEKFIVIAPKMKQDQILSTLKGLIPLFAGVAVVSGVLELFARPATFMAGKSMDAATSLANTTGEAAPLAGIAEEAAPTVANDLAGVAVQSEALSASPHYGLWFFAIASLCICTYAIYKIYKGGASK